MKKTKLLTNTEAKHFIVVLAICKLIKTEEIFSIARAIICASKSPKILLLQYHRDIPQRDQLSFIVPRPFFMSIFLSDILTREYRYVVSVSIYLYLSVLHSVYKLIHNYFLTGMVTET